MSRLLITLLDDYHIGFFLLPNIFSKIKFQDQGSPNTNGIDNEGFDDISYSIREKPSHSSPSKDNNNHFQNFPKSDERILLWQFEEPAESFLQTTEDKSGLKSEALASILGAIYLPMGTIIYFFDGISPSR